jgi:hypothetical protein
MTTLLTTFNVRWALAQRSSAVSTNGVALSLLVLAMQVLPQGAAKNAKHLQPPFCG